MKKSMLIIILILFLVFCPSSQPMIIKGNINPLEWYYDNLTPDDRLKIRIAMDLSIPREMIVKYIRYGWAKAVATPIGSQYFGIYNGSIKARTNDTEAAKDLLEEVFGYRFNASASDGTESFYFDMNLMAPNTYAPIATMPIFISKIFNEIGIKTTTKWWNWNTIISQIFTDPVGIGNDYLHGGYDALFLRWFAYPDIDLSSNFIDDYFPPSGDNFAWINNSKINDIWDRALTSVQVNERLVALNDFQKWCNDNVPMSVLPQDLAPYALDPLLHGFDTYKGGYYFQNLTHENPNITNIVYTIPEQFLGHNPLITNDYFDLIALENCHGSLTRRRGGYNITHPVGFLAESWNNSEDGLIWDVYLKQGVKFSNGNDCTANDVIFTYQAILDSDLNSPYLETFQDIFDSPDAIEALDPYHVRFTLPKFYPFMETSGLSVNILNEAEFESWGILNKKYLWRGYDGTQYIPSGIGPYIYKSIPTDDKVELVFNPYYNGSLIGYDPNATGGGIYFQNPALNITLERVYDQSQCLLGIQDGSYHGIDAKCFIGSFSNIQEYLDEIQHPELVKLVNASKWEWKELCYNQMSPIWGMNPRDPLEMYPEDYRINTNSFALGIFFGLIALLLLFLKKYGKLG